MLDDFHLYSNFNLEDKQKESRLSDNFPGAFTMCFQRYIFHSIAFLNPNQVI